MYLVEEIKNGIYWMGCNDFRTELFERIFPIPEGVSYNSYFIDDEKTCVIDAMDKSCRDEFLEDVEHLLNGRPLDYFILQHMEPDHSANILNFLKTWPQSKMAISFPSVNIRSSSSKRRWFTGRKYSLRMM